MIHMIDNLINKNEVKYLVIHCSDTEDSIDIGAIEIHKMHLKFGWNGVGYHKIICRNGEIENGRPEYWVGAHARGFNKISLGVCLIGKQNFTKRQFESLEKILRIWKKKYPKTEIIGHYVISDTKKTCPNFDVKKWCEMKKLI